MTDRPSFRLAATGARLLAGTLVTAVFAIAMATAVALPWPTFARTPPTLTAAPAPADALAVCAGPLLALGRDPERADALTVAAAQDVVVGAPTDQPAPTETALTAPEVPDSGGAAAFTAPPQGRTASQLAASGSAVVDDPDLSGFAASACRAPLLQSWIVGGATTTGSADLLVLGNPGEVPATVQLTVYGASGAQVPPGGADLVIPAGQQRVVPLAGLLLGEESPVVRVTATGTAVQAGLQSSITRTLVPGGVDQSASIPSAAPEQIIPGVVVPAESAVDADPTGVLRLLSADADATATVTVLDEDGVSVSSQDVPLSAGLPTALRLDGLAVGSYSIRVAASAPVVAAMWQATGLGAGSDFAWYAAAPALSGEALVAAPDGPEPTLHLFNAGSEAATLEVGSLFGGDPTSLRIAADGQAIVPLAAAELYRLRTEAPGIHAAVSFSGDGALAGMPLWPETSGTGTVVVYP